MIYTERLLKIIKCPHVSEKNSIQLEKYNIVVLKVSKYATKTDIKNTIYTLFSIKLKKINVLVTPKKKKGSRNNIGYRRNWKKAYVVLTKGSKLDFTNQIK